MRGIRVYHSQAVVQVLTKSLWVFSSLLPLLEGIEQVAIQLLLTTISRTTLPALLCQLPYRRIDKVVLGGVVPSMLGKAICNLE